MANDYSKDVDEKVKDLSGEAEQAGRYGKEEAGRIFEFMDRQLRSNPWPALAGAMISGVVFGCLMGSRRA